MTKPKETEVPAAGPEQEIPAQDIKQEVAASAWDISDIPTQTEPMIVNRETKKAYNPLAIQLIMLRKLENIEKTLGVK